MAAPPALETLFPCGGKAATSVTVTATGSNLEKGHPSVWTDHPGIVFKAGDKPKVFQVSLAPDVPPGPHLVRFYNAEGASLPHVFVVGRHDESLETEPNNEHEAPQVVPALPYTLHGRLEKGGDVDTFAVKLEAGEIFTAEVQGYALGSQMDPALKLLDDRGVEVALGHDSHNLDPLLQFKVAKTGVYFVQLMGFAHPPAADVSLKGAAGHIYRLTLSDQAFARFASPAAVQRGAQSQASVGGSELVLDATRAIASDRRFSVPASAGEPVFAALVSTPVSMEGKLPLHESGKLLRKVTAPLAVSGSLSANGEEDRFLLPAKRGDSLTLRVHASILHSPLDASLRIEDSGGKVLQQADDSDGSSDPALRWKAPDDGDFCVVVSDLFGRGGAEFCYALEIGQPSFHLVATLTDNAIKLDAGKSVNLKTEVKITAGKLEGKMMARVTGLPPGVTAQEVEVPAKGGAVTITLKAVADAAAASVPVELQLDTTPPEPPLVFKASYDLRGVEPRGDRLVNDDTRVWLTVTPSQGKAQPVAAKSTPSASEKPPATAPAAKP